MGQRVEGYLQTTSGATTWVDSVLCPADSATVDSHPLFISTNQEWPLVFGLDLPFSPSSIMPATIQMIHFESAFRRLIRYTIIIYISRLKHRLHSQKPFFLGFLIRTLLHVIIVANCLRLGIIQVLPILLPARFQEREAEVELYAPPHPYRKHCMVNEK